MGLAGVFRPWVHASVAADEVLAARHGALIRSHVLGSLIAATIFIAAFAAVRVPALGVIAAVVFIVAPIAIAALLSRTGRLDIAHLLSAAQLAALVVVAAVLSEGRSSFAVAWLALVPLEAALSGRARIALAGAVLALAALLAIELATVLALLPATSVSALVSAKVALAAQIGAVAYGGIVAAGVVRIQRGSRRELEASRERYRLIAENANDLVTRHDASGSTVFASLASAAIVGVDPGRLVAIGFEAVLHPDDRPRYRASLQHSLATGQPVSEEYAIEKPSADGTLMPLWLEMRCQPVRTADGVPSIVAVTRDITVRRAEAVELARARDEAQTASRAKTAFLATISHELRTPLNAIIGFSDLLQRNLAREERSDQLADHARVIHESGEHLFSLVQDLLDVSKIESGKFGLDPEAVSLAEIARTAVEALLPIADAKHITLDVQIAPALPDLYADRRATRQILLNLVANAVKFTPDHGRVEIAARALGDRMEIAVTDTGIGVSAEHIDHIGQPFYRVETSYARRTDGAGLGLSIVRGLVELHGGVLEIASEQGRGSRFTLTLPIDTGSGDETIAAAEASRPAPRIIDVAELHLQRARSLSSNPGAPQENHSRPLIAALP